MTLTKKIGTLSAIGFAMLAGQASAQGQFVNPEWANSATYIGAGIGQSRSYTKAAPVIKNLNALGGSVNSWNTDEKDMGYKLFVGKQLNRVFAVEAGFFDLGNFNVKAGSCCGVLNAEQKYKGVNLDLIAQVPMGERFSVYGRAGMHYTKASTRFTGTRAVGMFAGEKSEKKLNPKFGVGLEYKFTEALALRAEAENYRIDDALRSNGNTKLYSMNLVYKLGRPAASAPMPAPAPAPAPMPEATPAPAPMPAPAPAAPVPVSEKVSFAAEALFDFDKSVVKPEGKAALDDLLNKLQGMNTEVMVTVGHTDSVGSDAYNQKLSLRRAEAVKAYIVSKGVQASRVYTEGKGESQPVADNKTAEGRAKNRRVTVEVVGTRTTTK